jgi:hypothetical protein
VADPLPQKEPPMTTTNPTVQNEREERRRRQSVADFRAVVATPEGRRFVWELMSPAFLASFTGEALSTAYAEGRRGVANELLARLNDHAPDALIAMLTTAAQVRAADEAADHIAQETATRA